MPEESPKTQEPVYTPEHPEYPFLMYNHKTGQTAAAKDKAQKEELAKQGYVDDPRPPKEKPAHTEPPMMKPPEEEPAEEPRHKKRS